MHTNTIYSLLSLGGRELLDENGITSYGLAAIIVIILFVISFAILMLTDFRHKKKGWDSKAKKRIEEIVSQTVPAGERVTAAYASWLTVESLPTKGKRIYRYWWYAIGFNNERIYIVPLSISGKGEKIDGRDCVCIERSQLGLVNGRKNGNWVELYDKDQRKICTMRVEAFNTGGAVGSHMVDIAQPEAAKAFREFVRLWMSMVNSTNGVQATGFMNNARIFDLKAQYGNPENTGFAASAQTERKYK